MKLSIFRNISPPKEIHRKVSCAIPSHFSSDNREKTSFLLEDMKPISPVHGGDDFDEYGKNVDKSAPEEKKQNLSQMWLQGDLVEEWNFYN